MLSTFTPGSYVKFTWWSSYLAPEAYQGDSSRGWKVIEQNEYGTIIACLVNDNFLFENFPLMVLFSNNRLVFLHDDMLEIVNCNYTT